jgi:Na+/melibiose symporter-like transporter
MNVYRNRNFLLTYAASFISLFGSKLLMMSYVAYVYAASSSAALASIVFAAEWTCSLVIGLFGTRFIDRQDAKHLLIKLNLIAAVVTLSFAFFTALDNYRYAIAIIMVRALLQHAVSSSRIKALVQFFSKEETELFSPVFNSSLFIAIALAYAVGIFIQTLVSFTVIVGIDSATFLIAAALFALVRPNAERLAESTRASHAAAGNGFDHLKQALSSIARNRSLSSAVFYIILSVTAFQATYEIVMTTVPQTWFGQGRSGTALFFTFESVFVTLGAFLYQFLNRRGFITESNQHALNLGTIGFAVSVYLLVPQFQHHLYVTLVVINVMVVAVEMVWTHQFKQMIANTASAQIAAVTGVQMAMGYTLMGVFAFIFSVIADRWGITNAIYMNVSLAIVLVAGWELLVRGRTSVPHVPASKVSVDA